MSIFCMCGAQASYPHHPACPYPLFHGTDFQVAEWEKLFANRKAGLTAPSALPESSMMEEVAPQPPDDFFDIR